MAYKVLQSFRDIQTRVVYNPGSAYPADAPADRIEKLTGLSFIAADEAVETVTDNNTVAEIKALLDAKGIQYQSKSTKAELLSLLED
ncbi:HeH/LEM domain-containing protein [Leuconostoc citreum]|uniref:HeH/LEM domain-containing protein n=1 Tax=Leuconostoc citreum TaxID=33964 RepID=UPI001C1F68EB|nr:HeH/LEM domain-containing protein [Leuconostoc citreum]MBU7450664.1 hypothetical protein [Leuconostoc citreum]